MLIKVQLDFTRLHSILVSKADTENIGTSSKADPLTRVLKAGPLMILILVLKTDTTDTDLMSGP